MTIPDCRHKLVSESSDFELCQELINRTKLSFGEIVIVAQKGILYQVKANTSFMAKESELFEQVVLGSENIK